MKRRPFWWEWALFGVVSALLLAALRPVNDRRQRAICQSNLKRISLASKQYIRDYDEQNLLSAGWNIALAPYGARPAIFQCPRPEIGYIYNRNLQSVSEAAIKNPAVLTSFYEAPGRLRADSGGSWQLDGVHMGGTNVAFYDGHVKWMQTKPLFWTRGIKNSRQIQQLISNASSAKPWNKQLEAKLNKQLDHLR